MKQNALPGLALWILALLLVCADWISPSAHAVFASVGLWKSRYGLAFSATTTAFFGGCVPFLFLLVSGKIRRNRLAAELAFYTLFWAYKGVEVDLFYRLQSHLFGNHADPGTIVRKVLVDQFVYNPIWAAPMSALAFMWKESAFSPRALKSRLGFRFHDLLRASNPHVHLGSLDASRGHHLLSASAAADSAVQSRALFLGAGSELHQQKTGQRRETNSHPFLLSVYGGVGCPLPSWPVEVVP
jgi:hypothetical protein